MRMPVAVRVDVAGGKSHALLAAPPTVKMRVGLGPLPDRNGLRWLNRPLDRASGGTRAAELKTASARANILLAKLNSQLEIMCFDEVVVSRVMLMRCEYNKPFRLFLCPA